MLFGALASGVVYIVRGIFRGRMSAQKLYMEASDYLQNNDDVKEMIGTPMRSFGRDTGNESRRTFPDERLFSDETPQRLRIRFNISGPKGHILVYGEVNEEMTQTNEWAYLIVEDVKTKQVVTIHDQRDALRQKARERALTQGTDNGGGTGELINNLLYGSGSSSSSSSSDGSSSSGLGLGLGK